ncbi:MAG: Crp/Fnr family transcriptional regulator [Isosphaera sp.]|nr:Crp/Fnr family transcriptional regulator [Isosphaera sp.]
MADSHGGSGAPVENRLLAALPAADYDRVVSRAEDVALALRDTVYPADGPIDAVYFLRSGILSMVVTTADGRTAEVGMVGREGVAGLPAFLGTGRSPCRVFCQAPGRAWRVPAGVLREEAGRSDSLRARLLRYTEYRLAAASQSTACGQLHPVGGRCARWLLDTHDRAGGDEFPLTQEFLSMMLGVRRATVTVAAGQLQKRGVIRYRRGAMRVLNRVKLEAAACECYRLVRDTLDRALA